MADVCEGATLPQLAWAHDWHIHEETYAAALARLIDAQRTLPLAQVWGDGKTSSSDGQYFRAGGHGEALADVNARHGDDPGVSFYTHISDQFGPYHTKVIAATASEAPHVLDGLLNRCEPRLQCSQPEFALRSHERGIKCTFVTRPPVARRPK